jgi:hypothetical protein
VTFAALLLSALVAAGAPAATPSPEVVPARDPVPAPASAWPLRVSSPVTFTALSEGVFTLPDLCDSDGNIYVAPATDPEAGDPRMQELRRTRRVFASGDPDSVVRVSPDGKQTVRISLASLPEMAALDAPRIMAMTLGVDDDLFIVVKGRQGPAWILAFGRDGKLRSKTKVDVGPLAISLLAVFRTGEFLVAGSRLGDDGGPEPLLGVLDGGGSLLHPIRDSAERAAEGVPAPRKVLSSDWLAIAQPDREGSVYVARSAPQGPLVEVSRFGDVVRTLPVAPPEPGALLTGFRVAGRRAAVEHQGARGDRPSPPRFISVYDLATGERLAVYAVERGTLLCYRWTSGLPDTFALMTSDGRNLQLIEATGR